jgi:hypothetical protein
MTVVSFFHLGRASLVETMQVVGDAAGISEPIELSVVDGALYGPDYSIPVGKVEHTSQLRNLHLGLLGP